MDNDKFEKTIDQIVNVMQSMDELCNTTNDTVNKLLNKINKTAELEKLSVDTKKQIHEFKRDLSNAKLKLSRHLRVSKELNVKLKKTTDLQKRMKIVRVIKKQLDKFSKFNSPIVKANKVIDNIKQSNSSNILSLE